MQNAELSTNVLVMTLVPQPGPTSRVSAFTTHQRHPPNPGEAALSAIRAQTIESPRDPEVNL